MNIKKLGFTLPEVLITLTIVGSIAVLVLPGILKDFNAKASMNLLQSTVTELNTAMQQAILDNGNDYTKTFDFNDADPQKNFWGKYFNVAAVCDGVVAPCFGEKYFTAGSTELDLQAEGYNVFGRAVLLKNGVTLDYLGNGWPGSYNFFKLWASVGQQAIFIDLNGQEGPNKDGIDTFVVCMYKQNNTEYGVQRGRIGACINSTILDLDDYELKSKCNSGMSIACYSRIERSGFDPELLKQ